MSLSGKKKPDLSSKFSTELVDFVKSLSTQEIMNLQYTTIDGEEKELGFRVTRELGAYLFVLHTALLEKSQNPPETPPNPKASC